MQRCRTYAKDRGLKIRFGEMKKIERNFQSYAEQLKKQEWIELVYQILSE